MGKIYTKTGDDGTTGLVSGGRVAKSDSRLEVYGEIDEFNSRLGLAQSALDDEDLHPIFRKGSKLVFQLEFILGLRKRQTGHIETSSPQN